MKTWLCPQCGADLAPEESRTIIYRGGNPKTDPTGKWYVVLDCVACLTRCVARKSGIWIAKLQPTARQRKIESPA